MLIPTSRTDILNQVKAHGNMGLYFSERSNQ
nr:MAG TPA: hypothetical protein [Caudoviricetes sp.]